jgi:hypothetical protein
MKRGKLIEAVDKNHIYISYTNLGYIFFLNANTDTTVWLGS